MSGPGKLVARLLATQIAVTLVTFVLMAAVAPRLLLLDTAVLVATLPTALWVGSAHAVFSAIATIVYTRPVRTTLRALATGEDAEIDPRQLLVMYSIPARIAVAHVVIALVVSTGTLLPVFRPPTNDLYTQVALVLLMLTMVSAGALPLYVLMRASVAHVLELAPVEASREAIALIEWTRRTLPRVRTRFLLAVTAPVAFVALGASLLVYAHARAFDTAAREQTAIGLARGVFEVVKGSSSGRDQAIAEAEAQGFASEVFDTPAPESIVHASDEETVLTVPLEDGHAVVRFATTRLSPITGVYILLAVAAATVAGFLGSRIGARFTEDVVLATHHVRATGAADVLRGTRLAQQARFVSVRDLLRSIEDLGAVFRGFAAAQQHAIDAREATERMRGLFLASMSHDLKAPLNAILGFAALVSQSPLSDGQMESVAIIEQRGRELLGLIQTILDSARVEANALELSHEHTMMGDVVMSAVLDSRDLAVGSGVQITGEVQQGLPRLEVDSTRLVQALTNVIGTAVRFTDKGTVLVRATFPGDRLRIDVETSARGLPPGEREKIFEAFKHADRARRHGSLGLGLSLARSIVELHGGNIQVGAIQDGGLAFQVWLPVPPESVPASRSTARPPPISQR
jgi:signal transduction histidine kinase